MDGVINMLVGMIMVCLALGAAGLVALVLLVIWTLIDKAASRRVNRMVRSAGVTPVNVKRSPLAPSSARRYTVCVVCDQVIRPGRRDMPHEEYHRAAKAHLRRNNPTSRY